MRFANALVARICHDLVTPCNAISLGIDAYDMTNDSTMLSCIKESAEKANSILKFMRELFSAKRLDYTYTGLYLKQLISELLRSYNISFEMNSDSGQVEYYNGKIVMLLSLVAKEVMPVGGEILCNCTEKNIEFFLKSDRINHLDIHDSLEVDYHTVIRCSLISTLVFSNKELHFNQTNCSAGIIVKDKLHKR